MKQFSICFFFFLNKFHSVDPTFDAALCSYGNIDFMLMGSEDVFVRKIAFLPSGKSRSIVFFNRDL